MPVWGFSSLLCISSGNSFPSYSTAELNERVKQITQEAAVLKELAAELEGQIGIFHTAG